MKIKKHFDLFYIKFNKELIIIIFIIILSFQILPLKQNLFFDNNNYTKKLLISPNSFTKEKENHCSNNITNIETLIYKLNQYSNKTNQLNIIFSDYFLSKTCYDKSAYTLFEYYLNNSIDQPYYIINNESELYKYLLKENKTNNLILYNERNIYDFYEQLYLYLRNAKIIINAYTIHLLQKLASYVPYIKYLKINHGIKYFKKIYAQTEFRNSLGDKKNVICSSPYEYELLTKKLNYSKKWIYNASLVRYERFNSLIKNKTEKKCILFSFTYRNYNKYIFQKSEYKMNLYKILNDKDLILLLKHKNINLIYIPHHQEIYLGKNYSQEFYKYAQIKGQNKLEYYIEQCSLLVTDFSSISFDFMFQNKPVLFYPIDINDKNDFIEKKFFAKPNDTLYFGNYCPNKKMLLIKIKHFINNNFIIEDELKQKYESVFFYKTNIIKRLVSIIKKIVKNNLFFN